jgi:hypothetical protein
VLAVYEDEVVLLQEQLLQQGAERGLPGLKYQLAELQVTQHSCTRQATRFENKQCIIRQTCKPAQRGIAAYKAFC